jgi:hypothetical protein
MIEVGAMSVVPVHLSPKRADASAGLIISRSYGRQGSADYNRIDLCGAVCASPKRDDGHSL